MENANTLAYLKKAIDDAIYTYGQCLCSDIEKAKLDELLEEWCEKSVEIVEIIDEMI